MRGEDYYNRRIEELKAKRAQLKIELQRDWEKMVELRGKLRQMGRWGMADEIKFRIYAFLQCILGRR